MAARSLDRHAGRLCSRLLLLRRLLNRSARWRGGAGAAQQLLAREEREQITSRGFAQGVQRLQAVAKYVEEALQEYASTADRKLGNDMLARAASPHIEVMEMLLTRGAEPSLIDKDGDTVDANNIVQTYRALAKGGADAVEGSKDEL